MAKAEMIWALERPNSQMSPCGRWKRGRCLSSEYRPLRRLVRPSAVIDSELGLPAEEIRCQVDAFLSVLGEQSQPGDGAGDRRRPA